MPSQERTARPHRYRFAFHVPSGLRAPTGCKHDSSLGLLAMAELPDFRETQRVADPFSTTAALASMEAYLAAWEAKGKQFKDNTAHRGSISLSPLLRHAHATYIDTGIACICNFYFELLFPPGIR